MFRFVSGGLGIYEAVERDCPRGDSRRECKPDGSWLPKVGKSYPEAVSYWTEKGLWKYIRSGLQHWHRIVVNSPVEIIEASLIGNAHYRDEFQVIAGSESFGIERSVTVIR